MNLRQLKGFQVVCRTGSITRAAELIHLSQPALTRQIQDLESFCGCNLFERTRHGIVLTDEGELFRVRGGEMLGLAERTQRELKEAGGFIFDIQLAVDYIIHRLFTLNTYLAPLFPCSSQ